MAATLVHGALYAIMIALPVTGLAATRASSFATVHATLGWVALCIIAIHVGAALCRRIARQDDVLHRIAW